jgi:hypothetical protein
MKIGLVTEKDVFCESIKIRIKASIHCGKKNRLKRRLDNLKKRELERI